MAKNKHEARLNKLLSRLTFDKPIPIMELPRIWKTAERMADAGASDDDIAFVITPMIDAITVK